MQVIKIGGNELDDPTFLSGLASSIASMSEPVVIVHGGGRAIADLQSRLGIETVKVEGLRVTDAASLQVAEMVLSGRANKAIVRTLVTAGVDALGLSGIDRGLLACRKKQHPTADLGFVGEIVKVRSLAITQLVESGVTPVISPISLGEDGHPYNVNADEAAGAIAAALNVSLTFVSNVPGVLYGEAILPLLTGEKTESLIQKGIISDGMVPKVRAALSAINRGAPHARIVNLAGLDSSNGTSFVN